ncbi:MAG: hypothetical protein IJ776_02775 [Paludibacteraceae bacterium]|nr:hypothetical protein [Paludibacteraceae bacterium]
MKHSFIYALAAIVVALGITSCEGGGSVNSVKFRRMNLDGVNTLALASRGARAGNKTPARMVAAEEDELVEDGMAYSVSDDGTMVEITYAIDVSGGGDAKNLIKTNLRLSMQYVYTIGDEWLWLYGCNYVYPDLEDLQEPAYSKIKEAIAEHSDYHDNYLVRRKDGALFYWDGSQGRPFYGNVKWDAAQTDIYGIVEAIKGEIYANSDYHSMPLHNTLFRLKDEGDQLAVTTMHSDKLTTDIIMPDKRGAFGLNLYYQDSYGSYSGEGIPGVMFIPSGKIVGFDESYELISVNETLYALRPLEEAIQVFSVTLSEADGKATAGEKVAEISGANRYDLEYLPKVNRGEYSTWMLGGRKYLFDFNKWSLSSSPLPVYYPDEGYYQGIAYVMSDDQLSFYICDLSKSEAERVVIDYTELNADASIVKSTISANWVYSPRAQAFRKSALTIDGYETTIMLPVSGENKGKARVYKAGDTTAGQVISVMVRLN